MIQAGKLNKRLIFQINTPTANDKGELIDTWSNHFTLWGHIEPLKGNRYFTAKQSNVEVDGTIYIRYRSGILPTMLIVYGIRHFRPISIINPDEANEELQIMYKEIL